MPTPTPSPPSSFSSPHSNPPSKRTMTNTCQGIKKGGSVCARKTKRGYCHAHLDQEPKTLGPTEGAQKPKSKQKNGSEAKLDELLPRTLGSDERNLRSRAKDHFLDNEKGLVNEILAAPLPAAQDAFALVLDGKYLGTTGALMETKRIEPQMIIVPNPTETLSKILGTIEENPFLRGVRAVPKTAGEALKILVKLQLPVRSVILDYTSTFNGSQDHPELAPKHDVELIFQLHLVEGCVVSLTLSQRQPGGGMREMVLELLGQLLAKYCPHLTLTLILDHCYHKMWVISFVLNYAQPSKNVDSYLGKRLGKTGEPFNPIKKGAPIPIMMKGYTKI